MACTEVAEIRSDDQISKPVAVHIPGTRDAEPCKVTCAVALEDEANPGVSNDRSITRGAMAMVRPLVGCWNNRCKLRPVSMKSQIPLSAGRSQPDRLRVKPDQPRAALLQGAFSACQFVVRWLGGAGLRLQAD